MAAEETYRCSLTAVWDIRYILSRNGIEAKVEVVDMEGLEVRITTSPGSIQSLIPTAKQVVWGSFTGKDVYFVPVDSFPVMDSVPKEIQSFHRIVRELWNSSDNLWDSSGNPEIDLDYFRHEGGDFVTVQLGEPGDLQLEEQFLRTLRIPRSRAERTLGSMHLLLSDVFKSLGTTGYEVVHD